MIKIIYRFVILILLILMILITYLSTVGIKTNKFNNQIYRDNLEYCSLVNSSSIQPGNRCLQKRHFGRYFRKFCFHHRKFPNIDRNQHTVEFEQHWREILREQVLLVFEDGSLDSRF